MTDDEKCLIIKMNGAAERLHMIIDHILRRESFKDFDRTLIKTGVESAEHAIAEYRDNNIMAES